MKCPECHSRSVLRVKRRRSDKLLGYIVPIRPYRCQTCDTHFWGRIQWRHQPTAYLGFAAFWSGLALLVGSVSMQLRPNTPVAAPPDTASAVAPTSAPADAPPSASFSEVQSALQAEQEARLPAAAAETSDDSAPATREAAPETSLSDTEQTSTFYATTDRAHMREGAGQSFRSITILDSDRVLPAVEPASGEWIRVRHYDRTGYVHRSLLKPVPPPEDAQRQG